MRPRPEFNDWIASTAKRQETLHSARQMYRTRWLAAPKRILNTTILKYLLGGLIALALSPGARPLAIWGADWASAAANTWLCAGPHYKALCRPLLWTLHELTYVILLVVQFGPAVWLARRVWRWLTSRRPQTARANDSPTETTTGSESDLQRQLDRLRLRTARIEEQMRQLGERMREFETLHPHANTTGPAEAPQLPATGPPDPQDPEPWDGPRKPRPERTHEHWAIRLHDYYAQNEQPLYVAACPSDKTPEDSEVAVTTIPAEALQFPDRETAQAYWSDLFLARPRTLRIMNAPEPPISVTIFRAYFCRVPAFNRENP